MSTTTMFNRRQCFLAAGSLLTAGFASPILAQPSLLTDLQGHAVQLEDYFERGRWTLAMIWATTCHVCQLEIPTLSDYYREGRPNDLEIVGISLDGPDKVGAVTDFIEQAGVSYPNVIANPGAFMAQYRNSVGEPLRGTPTFVLFDPNGKLVANNPGRLRLDRLETYIATKRSSYRPANTSSDQPSQ